MWFKKINIKKGPSILPNLIWIIAISLIFLLWFVFIKNIEVFNFIFDKENILNLNPLSDSESIKEWSGSLTDGEKPENKINILVVWIWWWNHEAPNLTDTIILASINVKTKIISMLSIPRDLYVEYPWNYNNWKINWLYAIFKSKNNSQKEWMNVLKTKISDITWEKIDYFINVDFEWFKDIIDTIWWIEIDIPANFVDNQYPDWNWWYRTLVFKKWTWIFDWENALKYARSRHSTSDFDRSIRQQQVIKAIKEKLTWSYFLTSPLKIKELYDVFINRVYTDLSLSTIIKLAYNLNWTKEFKIVSTNLNDSCFYWSSSCTVWWFLYTPSRDLFWWMSVLLAEWTNVQKLNDYEQLHKYTDIVFNFPEIISPDDYKINIFNSIKVGNLAWKLSNDIVRYWFNIPETNSIWNTQESYEESVIYFNNIDENSKVIKALKRFFKWEFIETELPKYSTENANIEIIIWKDYLLNNNNFKF